MKQLLRFRVDLAWLLLGWGLLTAAYANALSIPFFWDDHVLVEQNPLVLGPDALQKVFQSDFWQLPHRSSTNAYYRPLVLASFVLDARLWGMQPAGFHATNLLLHFINCGLIFALVRRTQAPRYVALFAMLLFGALPRITESASWISGRTDVLAALGAALSVALYRIEPTAWKWRLASAVSLLCGLLSKEVALAGLIALIVHEWVGMNSSQESVSRQLKHSALNLFPALFATGLYLNLRISAGVSVNSTFALTFGQKLCAALQALGTYVWMLLTPFAPNLYVGTLGIFEPAKIALGILVFIGIVTAGIRILRRSISTTNATFLALSLAAIFPVLHLFRIPLRTLAADRFLYLPYFGLCVFLFANWLRIPLRMQRFTGFILGLLAMSFLWGTHERNREWQDELQLWKVTVERMPPKNGFAHAELAYLLNRQGRFTESLEYYEQGFALEKEFQAMYPDYQVSHTLLANWSLTLSTLGRFEQAVRTLQQLVAMAPNDAEYHHQYASVLARTLDFESADREFAEALRIYPDYAEARAIRKQTQYAAKLWSELPPETPNEPTPIRARRGIVYLFVGRIADGNRLWLEVVSAPDVTPELLRQANSILQNQRRLFGKTAETQALAEAIAKRQARPSEPTLEKP